MLEFKSEAWSRGVCHYYEDERVDIAINKYTIVPIDMTEDDFHILISIDGKLRRNEVKPFGSWEDTEKYAEFWVGEMLHESCSVD